MNNAKRVLTLTAAGLMALQSVAADTREWPSHAASERPRVVVLTDFPPLDVTMDSGPAHQRSDPDDIQSMVRFLVYANELEVVGLVASAATFANVANKTNLLDILNLYDAVDENLRAHDRRYPTADQLRAVTWLGRSKSYGRPAAEIIGPGRDSEASDQIIALLEKPDSRPVWFCVWGGSCDLAQALWKIQETRSAAEAGRLLAKVRVYLIALQDGSGQWILDTFPKLFVIAARNTWMGMFGSSDVGWVNTNVRTGHGPLGAIYPPAAMGTKPGVKEGDSPSFLLLVSAARGLNDPEQPGQQSWGGQFVRVDPARNHWTDRPEGGKSIQRWSRAFDNDFAARMDWCVKEFSDVNHPPAVSLKGGFRRDVNPGETVTLEAVATDRDGHQLRYQWLQFADAEPNVIAVKLSADNPPGRAGFVVPAAPGKTIRLILEVTDDGMPPLVSYQREVLNIK